MSQRLSRKEIKRDQFRETVEHAVDYATSHTRLLLQIGGAVLALAALVLGLFLYSVYRAERSKAMLARAIAVYAADLDAASPRPEDEDEPVFADEASRRARARELFEQVPGGTDAGAVARVYLGRIALDEGQPERARELWQAVLDDEPDKLLASELHVNLLNLDLQEGRAEAAAERLEAMLEEVEKPMPEDVILFHLATVREQLGRKDEAVSAYQRIVDEFPRSPYSAPAQRKTQALSSSRTS